VETPRGPLGLMSDPVSKDVDDPVRDFIGSFAKPLAQEPFEVAIWSHAGRPFLTEVRASASRAARMARWA
jgi:hypothetical protein